MSGLPLPWAGTVMMLLGSNSREVIHGVKERVVEIQRDLPPGVRIEPVYDRSDFVGRTLSTVGKNLVEGAVVVLVVLALFLGSLRGAVAVAVVLGIPASMTFALFGMHLFGVTGDLMSLGAIDFGFLVDGPIVMMEAVVAALAGRHFLSHEERVEAAARATGSMARPVVFSVAIIMLVYLPLFALQRVEAKAAPEPRGCRRLEEAYRRLLPRALLARRVLLGITVLLLAAMGALLAASPSSMRGKKSAPCRVAIQLYGPELQELARLSEQVGKVARGISGAGDVRVERLLGMPNLSVVPDRQRLARYGVRLEDLLDTLGAARVGVQVGHIYEGQRRYDLRLVVPPVAPTAQALSQLFVEAAGGVSVPLAEQAQVTETEGPAQVRREGLTRTVRVEVNLRGRDLVSWVTEATRAVAAQVPLPPGYRIGWGGQFENFERARARLGLVVPLALGLILGMLMWTFGRIRLALAVFTLVPLALVGGMAGLVARGLSFSIPAAVGFIALAGVAVLNGVVMTTEVRRRIAESQPLHRAILDGARHSLRAVLTTAAVAALGFLPMALSHGAGAEVQRPLATVVIAGIFGATALMLLVFPGILWVALGASDAALAHETVDSMPIEGSYGSSPD